MSKPCAAEFCRYKAVRGGIPGYCRKHGGGKRCAVQDCPSAAVSPGDTCKMHGGGVRCMIKTCKKVSDSLYNELFQHMLTYYIQLLNLFSLHPGLLFSAKNMVVVSNTSLQATLQILDSLIISTVVLTHPCRVHS